MTVLKRIWHNTIFSHQVYMHPNEKLAVYYHRTAATLYAIYAIWGVLATIGSIPTLEEALGQIPQIVFSVLTVLITIPACIGATHFPRLGRLELFSSSSFVALLVIYEFFVAASAVFGGGISKWAAFVLILSCLVVPLSRVVFIYVTLVRTAKRDEVSGA